MSDKNTQGFKDIDPNKYYTVNELFHEVKCFPWLKNATYRTYLDAVKNELEGENLLNVYMVKGARKNKYLVKGCDILSYLEKKLIN